MSAANTLDEDAPYPAPRDALAAAIARRQAIRDRLNRINELAAETFVVRAMERVEQAEAELAEARKREQHRLVDELLTGKGSDIRSVDSAQYLLDDAQDDLERCRRTRQALEKEQAAVSLALSNADRAVSRAISNVVQSEGGANALLASYFEAQREVARLREILSCLSSHNILPPYWDTRPLFPGTEADAPWRAALTALETDPRAPLPE